MAFVLGTNSRKNLKGVDAIIYKIVTRGLEISKYDFGIPGDGGIRTAQRQNELFKQGVTQLDGYKKESYHQSGRAFDVFGYVDGKANYEHIVMTHIAAALLQAASEFGVALEWGGFWTSFVDMPHYQLG